MKQFTIRIEVARTGFAKELIVSAPTEKEACAEAILICEKHLSGILVAYAVKNQKPL